MHHAKPMLLLIHMHTLTYICMWAYINTNSLRLFKALNKFHIII